MVLNNILKPNLLTNMMIPSLAQQISLNFTFLENKIFILHLIPIN